MISSGHYKTLKFFDYVSCHLHPLVKEAPSYAQEATNFLREINQIDFAPDNSFLTFLDV